MTRGDDRKYVTPGWLWWMLVALCISIFVGINIYVASQAWE